MITAHAEYAKRTAFGVMLSDLSYGCFENYYVKSFPTSILSPLLSRTNFLIPYDALLPSTICYVSIRGVAASAIARPTVSSLSNQDSKCG